MHNDILIGMLPVLTARCCTCNCATLDRAATMYAHHLLKQMAELCHHEKNKTARFCGSITIILRAVEDRFFHGIWMLLFLLFLARVQCFIIYSYHTCHEPAKRDSLSPPSPQNPHVASCEVATIPSLLATNDTNAINLTARQKQIKGWQPSSLLCDLASLGITTRLGHDSITHIKRGRGGFRIRGSEGTSV